MNFESALTSGISIGGGKGVAVEPKTLLGRQIIETGGSTTAQSEASITKNNDILNQQKRIVVDVKDIRQGLNGKARVEDNRTI
jgi:precorrin isomerase